MLLLRGIQDLGYDYNKLNDLVYDKYNRPSVIDGIDFNISHSGKYVLCAIGKNVRIGVDIEQVKIVDFSDYRNVMSDHEWREIFLSQNPFETFFDYWVIKESVLKADGRGLSMELDTVLIENNTVIFENNKFLFKKLTLNTGYSACLATHFSTELDFVIKYKYHHFY
jgi:4'-phosphopantetheinyl transferase